MEIDPVSLKCWKDHSWTEVWRPT